MSTAEGLHVPANPFVEVAGNAGTVPFAQIERFVPKLNVGVALGITFMVIVMGKPHWLDAGVNV